MRPIHFVSAGIAALLATSSAMAGDCSGGLPNDCDADGVLDSVDLCPFDADASNAQTSVQYNDGSGPLPTGDACTDASADVHPSAVIGHGVSLYEGARLFAQSTVGDYAQIGGASDGSPANVGVKATLIDAPSPVFGTVFPSGVIGRLAISGEDPSTVPQAAREGDVVSGLDLTTGRNAEIGFGARLGEGVTLGYAAIVGPQTTIGDRVTIGQLGEVGWGATIGNDFVLARSSSVGNFATIGDNVTIGPDVSIGTYASIGSTGGSPVRIRKGVSIGKWTTVEQGSRIGRNTDIGDYAEVLGVTLRANTVVEPGGVACDSAVTPPGVTTCADNGYYARNAFIPGNSANVPAEPSGTFFSAAGGVVCTNPGTNGCVRIPNVVNGVTRYCLDNNEDGSCDGGTPGVPAQAIVITAPDTIGVSPYCYNDGGSTTCETLMSEPGTCGGTDPITGDPQPPCYQLQAGPIYVLSPPDAN